MCSNYRPATHSQRRTLNLDEDFVLGDLPDVYPGGTAPMVRVDTDGRRICAPATFGMLPFWAKDRSLAKRTYNARSETVAEKPSFRHAWARRQVCVIPAMAIYEPCYDTGRSVWWRIWPVDNRPIAIAGLWEEKEWGEGGHPRLSFTMLTINAEHHPTMNRFHAPKKEKRSVVMLDSEGVEQWLGAGSENRMRDVVAAGVQIDLTAAEGRLTP